MPANNAGQHQGPSSAFESPTFEKDVSIFVNENISAASISPSGRDVVLGSEEGLLIIDLDNPYSPPRHIVNKSPWMVADVQWSPFASKAGWIVSTQNQKALVFNLNLNTGARAPIQHTLHAHDRAITDINFSAHDENLLATCSVDSFVYTWDLRVADKYATKLARHLQDPETALADFEAGASQVKWNRGDKNIIASSHNRVLRIWDLRHGARPLTTVEAHGTQIYGIDWHRSDSTKILTCSLDKTIKLWDKVGIDSNISRPCRVIRSDYPLWRARHTPFPNGILAMPQRGSSGLELYTHDAGGPEDTILTTKATHQFVAHDKDTRVQEFLWRTRGFAEDGIDNREFQLVSWGTDRHLRLHAIHSQMLKKMVGHGRGDPVREKPSTTRRGTPYITFRDGTPTQEQVQKGLTIDQSQRRGQLSSLLRGARGSIYDGGPNNLGLFSPLADERTTMTAGTVRRDAAHRVVNHITWMEGVTIGKHRRSVFNIRGSTVSDEESPLDTKSDLAAEISHVGNRFGKVAFENIDIQGRRITVSFNGPWGEIEGTEDKNGQRKLAFVRLNINFPDAYPAITEFDHDDGSLDKHLNPLNVEFERTTAAIPEEILSNLKHEMHWIANNHASLGREALEAIIGYGLGELSLEESISIPKELDDETDLSDLAEESSSDDEMGDAEDLNAMNSSASNTNMPPPRQGSVQFTAAGQLVVVKLASTRTGLFQGAAPLRLSRFPLQGGSKNDIFEAFGRLTGTHGDDSGDEDGSPTSSAGSSYSSSSPSSDSGFESEAGVPLGQFQPPLAWQKATLRFEAKTSHPSSVSAKPGKSKSIVAIWRDAIDPLIPSKKDLANEYKIFGDGPSVCSHNAQVARRFGREDLGDIWDLCGLILTNDVPLDVLPQTHRREPVLVLARRALVRIKRKDSGLDLQFDEAENVKNPKLKGRIKWGHHPAVSFLIPALFEHFEKLADVQMLAMLSCVFSEPAAREGVTSIMAKMRQSTLPMSMEAPAFSLDYFPSADAAWSLFRPTISIPSTPAHSRYATPVNELNLHRFSKTLDTYGSHGSSNGPWGSDNATSEPVTPYSTGNTPPNLSRAPTLRSMTASNTPFSTSPDDRPTMKKAPSTNFASAIASLSRPFANAMSSSPPVKTRLEGDLSTSAPTSGVTWGTTTFYSSGSHEQKLAPARSKHGKRASFGQADRLNIDYYSDSDSEYGESAVYPDGISEYTAPLTPGSDGDEAGAIRVTLKNQDRFDEEACFSAPLLDMSKEWLYRAWREQYADLLGCWGLVSKRAEVLKFNGLVSYFPTAGGSRAGSVHLVLKGENSEDTSGSNSAPLSRQSTLLPPERPLYLRRSSPLASPRHFSFNPEAAVFTPIPSAPETMAPPPDVFISSEQYLQLSFPTPSAKPEEASDYLTAGNSINFDSNVSNDRLKPHSSVSRAHSDMSRRSITDPKAKQQDPVYNCSICWLRVTGRVFWCPACRHVAHFDCMPTFASGDNYFATDDGECVVGCGCGCGIEDEEEVMDIDKFRAWDEKGGWLPVNDDSNNNIRGGGGGGGDDDDAGTVYEGDGVGRWIDRVERKNAEKKKTRGKNRG